MLYLENWPAILAEMGELLDKQAITKMSGSACRSFQPDVLWKCIFLSLVLLPSYLSFTS